MTIDTDARDRHRPPGANAKRPEEIKRLKRIAMIRKQAEARKRAEQAQKESDHG